MRYERIDREISEAVWQESLDMMSPEEIAEMVRRQEADRKADYWEAAFKALRETDAALEGHIGKRKPIEERFLSHVEPGPNGCMLWVGFVTQTGYGQFSSGGHKSKIIGAHKWYYEFKKGTVPKGLELDHLCRVRNCVNPAHLEPVTHKENTQRGNGSKTHCKHGHLYTKESTVYSSRGYRYCKLCPKLRLAEKKLSQEEILARHVRGENHPRTKLATIQVEQIREMFSTGDYTKAELGRLFGCSAKNISSIVIFKTRILA